MTMDPQAAALLKARGGAVKSVRERSQVLAEVAAEPEPKEPTMISLVEGVSISAFLFLFFLSFVVCWNPQEAMRPRYLGRVAGWDGRSVPVVPPTVPEIVDGLAT